MGALMADNLLAQLQGIVMQLMNRETARDNRIAALEAQIVELANRDKPNRDLLVQDIIKLRKRQKRLEGRVDSLEGDVGALEENPVVDAPLG